MNFHTHIQRAISFAFTNIFRNFWLSVMTITILILAVFSVSMIIGLNGVSKQLIEQVKSKVDVTLSFKPGVTEEEGKALASRLQNFDDVTSVNYITSQEALEQFKAEHINDPDIQETLQLLDSNPLPPRMSIHARTLESFTPILAYLNQDENNQLVETSDNTIEQSRIVISKLTDISEKIRKIGLVVTLVFIVISFLVIFNTIRIAIYTHREEIGIMKLVGASNWFIRAPFLIESLVYAICAVAITLAIVYPIMSIIAPQLNQTLFAEYGVDIKSYFSLHLWMFAGYQLLGVSLLSMASSSFAITRYLKV